MPMNRLPPPIPPTNESWDQSNDALIPVRMRVRDGQAIGLVDMDGNDLGLPITTQKTDGLIRKWKAGSRSLSLHGGMDQVFNTIHYGMNANAQNSASANVTRHACRKMLKPFIAWRARLLHYLAAGVNYKVAISWRTSDTELYGSFGTWYFATFGGAEAWTSTAGSGSGTNPNHVFATGISDLMFPPTEAQGNRLYYRTNADVAGNTRFDLSTAITGINSEGMLYVGAYQNGVDAIADPTAFVPTPHNSMPPVIIETFGYGDVFRMLWCGSSTMSGQGDAVSAGMVFRAEAKLNLQRPDVAWSFANFSAPGSTTQASVARGIAELARAQYDAAAYSIFSTNNTDKATAAGLASCKGAIVAWMDACYKAGLGPNETFLSTFQPGTSMNAPTYANCLELRRFALDLETKGLCTVLDFADLWCDVTASTPTWKDASKTPDGTHPGTEYHSSGGDMISAKVSVLR